MKSADGKFNQETEAIAMYKQKKALKILKKNRKKLKKNMYHPIQIEEYENDDFEEYFSDDDSYDYEEYKNEVIFSHYPPFHSSELNIENTPNNDCEEDENTISITLDIPPYQLGGKRNVILHNLIDWLIESKKIISLNGDKILAYQQEK